MVHLARARKVTKVKVTSGNSIDLKCDISGWSELVWKRNGGLLENLSSDDVRVFHDGSLYIADVGYVLSCAALHTVAKVIFPGDLHVRDKDKGILFNDNVNGRVV